MLVCRQQLEEMADKFKFSSVHQFAVEILKRNSAHRLTWLQQYYTSLNRPDLSDTVTNNFPQPDSALTSSSSASSKTAATKSHTDTRTPQKDFLKAHKNPKYTQKNPKSKTKPETPQNNVCVPQKKLTNPQNGVQEPHKNQKIPQKNFLEPTRDVPRLDSVQQEEVVCSARGYKRTKRGSVSASGAFRAPGGLGLDQASSSGLGSGEAAAFLNGPDRDTPFCPEFSHGMSTMLSKPTAQGGKREPKLSSKTSENIQGQTENAQTPYRPEQAMPTSSPSSFLTDLIGDTSILDDLLKPKSKASSKARLTSPFSSRIVSDTDSGSVGLLDSLSSPKSNTRTARQAPSRSSGKDFWDILAEGNEESINRLTDPAEVQRVCVSANIAAGSRSGGEESRSLWKTNEKFLWKK